MHCRSLCHGGLLEQVEEGLPNLAMLGWNCGIPPGADSLLWSPCLTKGTRSGCPIKCNTFLLQASDNINEGDLKTASSKLRIIYCQSSVMSRAKD